MATLAVPGTDTSQWIGQACLTGSGTRAVVVHAPRQITNAPDALGSGALTAVVNLATGQGRQVGAGVSIAYFDPGCGTGQDAILTQGGTGAGQPGTRLMMLNAISGQITATVVVPGQVTSAVPFGTQIAGVRGDAVVSIGARGRTRTLTATDGRAYRLAPDGQGGLGFLVAAGRQVQGRRWAVGRDRLVGSAALGSVELSQVGGQVFVTGERASRLRRLPRGWRALDVTAGSEVSSTGLLAVSLASTELHAKGSSPLAAVPDLPRPVSITAQVTATGRTVGSKVPAAAPPRGPAVLRTLPGFPGASHRPGPSRRGQLRTRDHPVRTRPRPPTTPTEAARCPATTRRCRPTSLQPSRSSGRSIRPSRAKAN